MTVMTAVDHTQPIPGASSEVLKLEDQATFTIRQYAGAVDLAVVMQLVDSELSEPYSIFTYRYFLHTWPQLCFLAVDPEGCPFGTIVCKADMHREHMRGYIAMVVVDKRFRGKGVGRTLVRRAIEAMVVGGCEEVVLEAEITNTSALKLYEGLGFLRDKRLHRYYLSGNDADRLKLLLPVPEELQQMELLGLKPTSLPPLPPRPAPVEAIETDPATPL